MKLSFDEALERISDGHHVQRSEIQARALSRVLWVAEWHLPGCLSESFSHCLTKRDAIEAACSMAETENGTPRGMVSALRSSGRFDCRTDMYGTVINTVSRCTLSEIL